MNFVDRHLFSYDFLFTIVIRIPVSDRTKRIVFHRDFTAFVSGTKVHSCFRLLLLVFLFSYKGMGGGDFKRIARNGGKR